MRKKVKDTGLKIERNIPVPTQRSAYPINLMKAGDSFLVAVVGQANSARGAFNRLGIKCMTRKVDGGFRVWRVK